MLKSILHLYDLGKADFCWVDCSLFKRRQQKVKMQITGGSVDTDGCGRAAALIYLSSCYYLKHPIYLH